MPTELTFVRATGVELGLLFYVWVFVILAASSNAVNLTDGLDGLASGSSILVLSAYVFIAFWQFRHTCALIPSAACYPIDVNAALDLAIVAGGRGRGDRAGSCGGTRRRPGSSWATPARSPSAG